MRAAGAGAWRARRAPRRRARRRWRGPARRSSLVSLTSEPVGDGGSESPEVGAVAADPLLEDAPGLEPHKPPERAGPAETARMGDGARRRPLPRERQPGTHAQRPPASWV